MAIWSMWMRFDEAVYNNMLCTEYSVLEFGLFSFSGILRNRSRRAVSVGGEEESLTKRVRLKDLIGARRRRRDHV